MGRDGKLYLGGESAGGNSLFRWNPRKLGQSNQVKGDKFHHLYNTAANHISYYARLDPAAGELLKGQFILARLSSNKGNAVRMHAITTDEDGNVDVGGVSTFALDKKNLPTVAGDSVAPAGGFVLVVSSDFSERLLWTTFEKEAYTSTVKAVALGNGIAAIASNAEKDAIITHNAVQKHPNNLTENRGKAYIAIWPRNKNGA